MTGKVKFFKDVEGYGFIQSEEHPGDIFVHQTAIRMEGYRVLYPNQTVEFELKRDERGWKAANVRLVEPGAKTAQVKGA
jgi:CspA family cold shock protein